MSSPKSKAKSSVNQQVKAGLSAVKDFLAGRSGEARQADAGDKATREVVGAELLSAMSGRQDHEQSGPSSEMAIGNDTQEIPRLQDETPIGKRGSGVESRKPDGEGKSGASLPDPSDSGNSKEQEQERARKLFLDHGYFDEAVQNLRGAKSPAERVAAARALGHFGSQRGTPHLIAAMFDNDQEVCAAAEEAMAQIGDPMMTQGSTQTLTSNEPEKANELKLVAAAVVEKEEIEREPLAANITPIDATSASVSPAPSNAIAVSSVDSVLVSDTPSELPAGSSVAEENQLLQEEQAIRETVEQLGRQLLETAAALKETENEIRWRIEREGKLRSEAADRLRDEEELRKHAAQEAETRRTQEQGAFAVEQAARLKAESEAQQHADEQTNLRLKAARLRLAAEELARRRADMETARREAAAAEREAEAARARDEAKSRHEAELKRLRSEQEALQSVTNEVEIQQANIRSVRAKTASDMGRWKKEQAAADEALREKAERMRSEAKESNRQSEEQLQLDLAALRQVGDEVYARRVEVEAARAKAQAEAERLVEAQARMKSAEEVRDQTEAERLQLEAEINQQVETQLRLLEETRRRGEEEQQRVIEETRRNGAAEQRRLAELEVTRAKAEVESRERAEKEQQILSQIDSLRIADAETRRRIEDAEVRRRAAEDAYRLVAEKVQRVEAEAHARVKEEERILAKLEAERRTVAIEAQSRAEQEKRIKEEIEMFRRLEEQERPRLEEATLQLATAEARLQERKERLREDEEARALVDEELTGAVEYYDTPTELASDAVSRTESVTGTVGPANSPATNETVRALDETSQTVDEPESDDQPAASALTPAIATYLNSVDPYKRAAAVAELARSGVPDAFDQIVGCFDDHSPHVRNAAARALRRLEPNRTVDLFNRALEEASADRRRNIGAAIAASGLASDAINNLASENREDTYNALSILFVMAKTGEVEPLVSALQEHQTDEIGKAVAKLLNLSGH